MPTARDELERLQTQYKALEQITQPDRRDFPALQLFKQAGALLRSAAERDETTAVAAREMRIAICRNFLGLTEQQAAQYADPDARSFRR